MYIFHEKYIYPYLSKLSVFNKLIVIILFSSCLKINDNQSIHPSNSPAPVNQASDSRNKLVNITRSLPVIFSPEVVINIQLRNESNVNLKKVHLNHIYYLNWYPHIFLLDINQR